MTTSLYKVEVWVWHGSDPGNVVRDAVLHKQYYIEARSPGQAEAYAKKLYIEEFLPNRIQTSSSSEILIEHAKDD